MELNKTDLTLEQSDLTAALGVLGFSEKEIRVLMFLLSAGRAAASTIALRTKMKRSSCYLILDSLIQKGVLSKNADEGILAFSLNEYYSFKADREAHAEASKKAEKAFARAKGVVEPIDFDEILDVAMGVLNANLNELYGLFLIDEQSKNLVSKRVNLLGFGIPITNLIGKKLCGLKVSLTCSSNDVVRTATTGRAVTGESFRKFICPVVSRQAADAIQMISSTKYLYSSPIRTDKKIYGVGLIAFRSREEFIEKRAVFERIMNGLADCIDLKVSLNRLSLKSFGRGDLNRIQHQVQKIPTEIFDNEFDGFFAKTKIREIRNAQLLIK